MSNTQKCHFGQLIEVIRALYSVRIVSEWIYLPKNFDSSKHKCIFFFIKQQQFPKKLPMSQSVPQIYSQVKEFIYASLKFSESLHRRWADSTNFISRHSTLFSPIPSHHAWNEDTDGNSALDAELLLLAKHPKRKHLAAEFQSFSPSLISCQYGLAELLSWHDCLHGKPLFTGLDCL